MSTYADFWYEPQPYLSGRFTFCDHKSHNWMYSGGEGPCLLSHINFCGYQVRALVSLEEDSTLLARLYYYPSSERHVLKLNARNTERFRWAFQRMGCLSYHEVTV